MFCIQETPFRQLAWRQVGLEFPKYISNFICDKVHYAVYMKTIRSTDDNIKQSQNLEDHIKSGVNEVSFFCMQQI
jgi:hypothetical protein